MNKFKNIKTKFAGFSFDSRGEASRYGELMILERTGQITKLRRQVTYELAPAVMLAGEKRKKPALRFVADFEYLENGRTVVEDFKSPITAAKSDFRIKRHLMKSVHAIDVMVTL